MDKHSREVVSSLPAVCRSCRWLPRGGLWAEAERPPRPDGATGETDKARQGTARKHPRNSETSIYEQRADNPMT